MMSFDEVADFLDDEADELPLILYRELNGGISLLPRHKFSPNAEGLLVLGEYCKSRSMGRYINIYYGSFEKAFPHYSDEQLKEKLKQVLVHELTHHNESLAGVYDLEIKDAVRLNEYKERKRQKDGGQ